MSSKFGLQNAGNTIRDIRHDLLLNFSEDCLFDGTDRTSNGVYVQLPYPIHMSFKTTEIDSLNELLIKKQQYNQLLEEKRRRYKLDKNNIFEKKIANSRYLYLPKHLLEFYGNKDPDPYFNCDYNYYYTGGFLEHVQINNNDYLIRPDGLDRLCLTDLNEPFNPVVLNYDLPSKIHNIRAFGYNDSYLLLFRAKHNINIAYVCDVERLNNIWTYDHRIPLLDAKLNHLNHKQVGFVDASFKLCVKDIETGRTIISYNNKGDIKSDNFQQLQFLDNNRLAISDRYQVKFIDCRTKKIEDIFNPDLLECNSLCNYEIKENNLFLTARHYLIKSDLRKLKSESYFSHSMKSAPCYMSFGTTNNDTFLCVAGQEAREYKVLFTGKSPFSLPYKVPGIHNTLKECRLNNPSMVLQDKLDDRLNFAVTGLKVLNHYNNICIYWTNSLGEIFRQKVSEDEPDKEEPLEALTKWVNNLEKTDPVLHLTCVQEMSSARFSLNTKPTESNLKKYKDDNMAEKFLQKYEPIYSRKHVTSTLAKDFLTLWDGDEDDEEDDMEKLPEVPPIDKVNSWIQTNDFSDGEENSLGFLNTSKS